MKLQDVIFAMALMASFSCSTSPKILGRIKGGDHETTQEKVTLEEHQALPPDKADDQGASDNSDTRETVVPKDNSVNQSKTPGPVVDGPCMAGMAIYTVAGMEPQNESVCACKQISYSTTPISCACQKAGFKMFKCHHGGPMGPDISGCGGKV